MVSRHWLVTATSTTSTAADRLGILLFISAVPVAAAAAAGALAAAAQFQRRVLQRRPSGPYNTLAF